MNKRDYLILFVILIIGLILRLGVWICYYHTNSFIQIDTMSYWQPGIQLLEHGNFTSFLRTPVYPVFLAFCSKFISSKPDIIALAQIIISLLSISFVFYICRIFFGIKKALMRRHVEFENG